MANSFKSKTDKRTLNLKFIGCQIKKEAADRLSLISLKDDISKSDILKNLVYPYLEKFPSLEELINQIAIQAEKDWKKEKKKNQGADKKVMDNQFKIYLGELEKDLGSHRISDEIVELIISKIRDLN